MGERSFEFCASSIVIARDRGVGETAAANALDNEKISAPRLYVRFFSRNPPVIRIAVPRRRSLLCS